MLQGFMRVRWTAFVVILLCGGITWAILGNIQSELAPMEDRNQFRMQLTAPEGTAYDYMDNYVKGMVDFVMDSVPEYRTALSLTAPGFGGGSVNSGFVRVTLSDPGERTRSQQQIVDAVNKNLKRFPQGRAFTIQEQTISADRRGGLPVQFVIQNNNFDKLKEALPKFLEAASANPTLQTVDIDLKFNKPELRVLINRLKASQLGVSVQDI
jgi:multidrug efflux pump